MTEARADGWVSAITGIGTMRDVAVTYAFMNCKILEYQEATSLYNFYDLAARICELPVEESLAASWGYMFQDRADLAEPLEERLRELEALQRVADAAVWGRVHGDCFLYMSVEDGRPDNMPVGKVRRLNFLRKVERQYLAPTQYYVDMRKENFGQPSHYSVTLPGSVGAQAEMTIVHESRFLKFYGARTSQQDLAARSWWHFSVLQRPYDVLREFGIGWLNAGRLLGQSTQGIYKVDDLIGMLSAPGGAQKLSERMGSIDLARGALKSIMVDAEKEDFRYEVANLSGLSDILDRYSGRLSSAAGGIPITKLFGISPSGLNATGEHDAKNWAKILDAYRRDRLQPEIWRLTEVLLQELKAEGTTWALQWPELETLSELETAQAKLVVAQTDVAYVTAQILAPHEVALQRFANPESWKAEIIVDPAERQEDGSLLQSDQELEEADAQAEAGELEHERGMEATEHEASLTTDADDVRVDGVVPRKGEVIKQGPRGGSYVTRNGKKYYLQHGGTRKESATSKGKSGSGGGGGGGGGDGGGDARLASQPAPIRPASAHEAKQAASAQKHVFGRELSDRDVNEMAGVKGLPADLKMHVRVYSYSNKEPVMMMHVTDSKGSHVADLSRDFTKNAKGEVTAHQATFFVAEEHQGGGVGKALFNAQIDAYEKHGISQVKLEAAYIGKYVWAKAGFEFGNKKAETLVKKELLSYLMGAGQYDYIPKIATPLSGKDATKVVRSIKTPRDIARLEINGDRVGKTFLTGESIGFLIPMKQSPAKIERL